MKSFASISNTSFVKDWRKRVQNRHTYIIKNTRKRMCNFMGANKSQFQRVLSNATRIYASSSTQSEEFNFSILKFDKCFPSMAFCTRHWLTDSASISFPFFTLFVHLNVALSVLTDSVYFLPSLISPIFRTLRCLTFSALYILLPQNNNFGPSFLLNGAFNHRRKSLFKSILCEITAV